MSCEKCEDEPLRGAWYRWKNANVEIVACEEHWLEITEALNFSQQRKEEEDGQEKS